MVASTHQPLRVARASASGAVAPLGRGHGRLGRGRCAGSAKAAKASRLRQRLAALDPPVPLAPDRGAEADLEHRVEVLVGVAEDRAEQPVDLLGRDRGVRQPAGQVDVADAVDGEGDAVHAGVVLQQEGPQLLAVLVGLAA